MFKMLSLSFMIFLIVISMISCISFQTKYEKKQMVKIEKSKNYSDDEFVNRYETDVMVDWGAFKSTWKWLTVDENTTPDEEIVAQRNKINKLIEFKHKGLQVVWIGHSTVLINLEGKYFITDPVFAKRVSPYSWIGPKRFFKPTLKVEDLPELSGVIISHDHYDRKYLVEWGVSEQKLKEFDWWDEFKIDEKYTLIATPARHFSGRGLFDRNETLWASWVLKTKKHSVYFGGDSGYSPDFKIIGNKYGPFDITMLEVGAYDELWPNIHLGPKNAIQAHLDLRGKAMLPIHWGTFKLATHPWSEPAEKLVQLAKTQKINLLLPSPGVVKNPKKNNKIKHWWKRKIKVSENSEGKTASDNI
jgi:L-ascorbate metabolism protein UlaG (beta-lactamase superfamily)